MYEAEARVLLESMTQWETDPALTSAEVSLLLDKARRADADGNVIERPWLASVFYPLDAYVVPTAMGGNGHIYRTTTAGFSGTAEPSWPSSGTVTSGVAVFTEAGVPAWVPTWDLNYAAAEGWRWKAAKVANQFQFSADGQAFQREQVYDHCLTMAKEYSGKGAASIPVGRSSTYSRY